MDKNEELHIGKEIQRVVKIQGRKTSWLAEQIGCNRNNIYNIYTRDWIDTKTLLHISNALEYDFFAIYSKQIKTKSAK